MRSGTVRVLASTCSGTGIGTGFLLDSRTVLTALPTVARAVSVAVVVDGKPVPATVQAESRSVGFASLRLSRAVPGHHFQPSSTTLQHRRGRGHRRTPGRSQCEPAADRVGGQH